MKKIILCVLGIVFIAFLIPIFFTNVKIKPTIIEISEENNQTEDSQKNKYEYSNYNTIKLYHSKSEEVQEIGLDEYLLGVVSAEMPASYEIEALKAQAIVARTYTIYTIIHNQGKHYGADICDSSTCCQAWISKEDRLAKWEEIDREVNWNKISEAVNSTIRKNNYL